MNRILKYISAFLVAASTASCSGTVDQNDTVSEDGLRIYADKTEITADGNELVTFTVKLDGEDVSNAISCQLIRIFNGEEKYMAYGVNTFSTATAGTYTFRAKYRYGETYETVNEVTLEAKPFYTGDARDFRRRFFGTLFTSTGCNSCPSAAKGLRDLQEENPGDITIAAFHADMGVTDPMTNLDGQKFNAALGGERGLPAFYWNMRESSYTGGGIFVESFMNEKEAYQTFSGVSIDTEYNETTKELKVDLGITSNIPAVFRYIVILVEDNISSRNGREYEQAGAGNGEYIHNNVARKALTSPQGDQLNNNLPLTVGVEVRASETVVLQDEWKVENMRVIVAATTSEDNGRTWIVNNVNECMVGEKSDYIYAE